jgi:hypothetical protein
LPDFFLRNSTEIFLKSPTNRFGDLASSLLCV